MHLNAPVGIVQLIKHFVLWGALGLLVEVIFTGLRSFLKGDKKGTSETFLWMLSIYGLGGLALEYVQHNYSYGPVGMILAYTLMIYLFEYTFGWLLRLLIGVVPWDYSKAKWNVQGVIRIDYLPFWLGLAAFWYYYNQVFLRLIGVW